MTEQSRREMATLFLRTYWQLPPALRPHFVAESEKLLDWICSELIIKNGGRVPDYVERLKTRQTPVDRPTSRRGIEDASDLTDVQRELMLRTLNSMLPPRSLETPGYLRPEGPSG